MKSASIATGALALAVGAVALAFLARAYTQTSHQATYLAGQHTVNIVQWLAATSLGLLLAHAATQSRSR